MFLERNDDEVEEIYLMSFSAKRWNFAGGGSGIEFRPVIDRLTSFKPFTLLCRQAFERRQGRLN